MIENSPIRLRAIQISDIANCKLLSDAEGWNQTVSDWAFLVNNSKSVCVLDEIREKVIGTATAINYSGKMAWIGMVLVDENYRGRGIGKLVISNLLKQLHAIESVKLDATVAGRQLYEKFGFRSEYRIHRMINFSPEKFCSRNSEIASEAITESDIPEITELDASVFGVKRTLLINWLYTQNPELCRCIKKNGKITAFALGRPGRKYQQIGPVFALTIEDAKVLISQILEKNAIQPIVVDVLAEQSELIYWLDKIGFTEQRDFVRMYLNENPFPGKPEHQFLICGPEFG